MTSLALKSKLARAIAASQHQEKRTLMISGGTMLGLELFIVLQVSDVTSDMQVLDSYVIIASPHVIIAIIAEFSYDR